MSVFRVSLFVLACWLLASIPVSRAQSGDEYDPSWYNPDAPYVQIDVASDGVYRVSGSLLRDALPDGTSLSDISPQTIQLFEKGEEIPIRVSGAGDGRLDGTDTITFVGRRNRGTDEHWAYNYSRRYNQRAQSSTYYSLYSDTTTYWMTWGGESGRRYSSPSSSATTPTSALRDTLHAEQDNRYYFGRPFENGNSIYTFAEGYFWTRLSHNDASPQTFTHTLSVDRRTTSGTLDLSVRLDSGTDSCHRVELEAELQSGFQSLETVEWRGYERQTLTASISQTDIPSDGLTLRITSYNDNFSNDNCSSSNTPNHILVDWIEAAYTRSLQATSNTQRFVAPTSNKYTFTLSGYTTSSVHVYNPLDAHRYEVPVTSGTASVTDNPSTASTPYWAVGPTSYRSPAALRPDTPSNWSAPSNTADYLLLTTKALLPSAQKLANYRRSHDGYDVEIALLQNIFDEFDYGRPTPIAIRRFVHASQNWNQAPDFLTIFADAQYPIRDGSVDTLYPEWSVPSFGYSPSDGWFAMQTATEPEDWSEVLAVGRIPVRSVAQGDLFVEKLKTYEAAPLNRWQKRMLLLAGGTSESEQDRLQDYSNRWGEIASDTLATTPSYTGPVNTGADTIRYYKNVNDALDTSFQDSLSVDLKRGAGWLSYFGHSAAQTWEIVTDPPSEFDNAGRLPVVVSLGCRTGAFAGGRFEEKSAPSLGEQIVVGSVQPDGTPRDGALNGGIAHFGESALGNRLPSARINDALIRQVFVDTSRVLGEAIRSGKAEIAEQYGGSQFYVKHLLQYGLLGDPATNLSLPKKPDLHIAPRLISIEPSAPIPSDELQVKVTIQNYGLIPKDSVDVHLTWQKPEGQTVRETRRLQRFALNRTIQFSFSLDDRAIGTNTFRVRVDPDDAHAEANETNNTAEQTKIVFDSGVTLLSPSKNGTVPSSRASLRFAVPRQTNENASILVQLDSVPDFSSPYRQEVRVDGSNFIRSWQSPTLESGQTYYWRARVAEATESTWESSNFTVAPALPEGSWLQQGRLFSRNTNTQLDRVNGKWRFEQFSRTIMNSAGRDPNPNAFIIDGTSNYEYLQYGFSVLVMNDLNGRVRDSESFPTYDLTDRLEDEIGDQQEAIDSLATFLDNVAQKGDYVFVSTRHFARESGPEIPEEVKSIFKNMGTTSITDTPHSKKINDLTYNDTWALKARKGFPGETVENVDADRTNLETRLSFPKSSGSTLTSRIGPASEWTSLQWEGAKDTEDDLIIDVLAQDSTTLIANLTEPSGQKSLDQIDPEAHPYLRLRATLKDSKARTAPQLLRWSMIYDGVPELAIDPAGLRSFPDTLQQGKDLSISLPISNLGPVSSDSIFIQYDITDASNSTTILETDTLTGLPPNATDTSGTHFSTTNFPGLNVLTVKAKGTGPPERIVTNNAVIQSFFVQPDQTSPTVTVFANGQELPPTSPKINAFEAPSIPFVSTQPSFDIRLRDDNPYLSLADTSYLDIYLKGGLPSKASRITSDFERIPFASNQLTFTSSDSSSSRSARARFTPSLSDQDSTYTLKVEAKDSRGNETEPYQGSFRIKPNQEIHDVYPYPNPMSSHTTFAFRVVGGKNDKLRNFRLRIYTLSGRLVREFDQTDLRALGPDWYGLRWNGQDEDGDRVATGVYLYQADVEGTEASFEGDVEKITVIR